MGRIQELTVDRISPNIAVCNSNSSSNSSSRQSNSSKGLLQAPTCVHHSGCGLWKCEAGPPWSYNQQEGFQVLGATCWILLASFGAYSPEKVSHGRIENPAELLRILTAEMRAWNISLLCPDRSTHNQGHEEQNGEKSSKGMTENDVRWETNQPLHKESSRAGKVIIKLFTRTTYRYNGKNSLCLRVPKKYIQERDDLYGLAQAHAMC